MDTITFSHDTVLSEVHLLLPKAHSFMTRLNHVGQPVFLSKFRIMSDGARPDNSDPKKAVGDMDGDDDDPSGDKGKDADEGGSEGVKGREGNVGCLDKDGDFDLRRRPRRNSTDVREREVVCPLILSQSTSLTEENRDHEDKCFKDMIWIEHTMATPLEDVGKQVWRGALFLADFILSQPLTFRDTTVIELGAGTGLASIAMATTAKTVYCTDVGEDLLSMCKRNVTLNRHLLDPSGGEVRVRQLDWLHFDLPTDGDVDFSWTEEEVADVYNNTSFMMAADVFYDDVLTDGFFRTVYQLCSNFLHSCTIYLTVEKRMNFTLRHLDISCDAYDCFHGRLNQLKGLADGRCTFSVEQVSSDFPQSLLYERVEQLVRKTHTFVSLNGNNILVIISVLLLSNSFS
ncbi:methyltransferase-like protein 22 [Thalassophryne amazonica]|uniref:methyltransferase-like protein 22 n=1 Tax=Thalassophryne amazonica TaxID=390379 RepID=UPI00147184B9|nr:methyltransferase-like protein 22 [Thalassophryne amazonica]